MWGYRVLLYHKPREAARTLAETLPPSLRRHLRLLGIDRQVEAAGFYRTTGNTSWWGSVRPRKEDYPQPGYQVLRSDFDALLLKLAVDAGVELRQEAAPRDRNRIAARYVLDSTGRAGVIARQGWRVRQPALRTIALCGVWEKAGGWPGIEPSHTLVESYSGGWAWSVPVSPTRRYVTFMVDPGSRGSYEEELAKTRAFRRIFAGGALAGRSWGADASLYTARRFALARVLLVGDAGSFVDPLSSFGVKKALASAWMAAVTVNTCLQHPEMAATALGYFDQCERQVYADHLRMAASFYREAAKRHRHPFWTERAGMAAGAELYDPRKLRASLARLKGAPSLRLRPGDGVRREPRPAIRGREIVMRPTLLLPPLPEGLEYAQGVHLPTLVELAPSRRSVPALFDAYNRRSGPVPLPAFLGALALLVASQVLL
jgi:flavin-dependent dehydrogenase